MDDVTLARALHVLALVHWIGGVSFVTLVILPLARGAGVEGAELFARVERRFSAQVRVSIPLAGAAGFWMTARLDMWDRFISASFWWMSAMVALWLVFMGAVFLVEPLLKRRLEAAARAAPDVVLARALVIHLVLLALAAATILGATAGAHGLFFP
ncbi:hypothetical protein EZH22_25665 [Xanthobacter dioxanivorans]|uniref:Copper resistance protein D domain-containing protein n=1 Tax=Xanthobacter dioxanivorans TaxID=2528964 RepID=A0A974PNM6_9HYPH|nr:hypothetical protein [Xanthobacter dioxanivorans]QRG06305.1 hypothetical protein EZH22_25665 [Xanthobacter dioxanivorans]